MTVRPRLPRLGEWLVRLSLPADDLDAVLGDLAEDYEGLAAHRGAQFAARWYWRQVLISVGPNLRRRMRSIMEALLHDLRYGARMIARRPIVTSVALASLVIGITLPAIVFSLLNAVVFKPLPVTAPDELAVVLEVRTSGINHNLPYPDFVDYRAAQHTFVDLAAYSLVDVTVRRDQESRVVVGELVSGSFFQTIGVRVRAGRGIGDADDRPGGELVAVVSEELWRQLAGRGIEEGFAPQRVLVNAHEFAVVGVAAAPFRGMEIGRDARIWLPIHAQPILNGPGSTNYLARRGASWLTLIGRLRPGVSREAAAADLNQIEAALAPTVGRPAAKTLTLAPGRQGDSNLPTTVSAPLTLLLGAGVIVLLVAAANVASLLVARANERVREMAVRAALGARRARLARLLFTETFIIGVAGTALAMAAAKWLSTLVVPFMARYGEAVVLDMSIDWRIAAFVGALGLAVTALAAAAPAIGALRSLTPEALSEGGRASSEGHASGRLRRGLVVAQFALSLSLVVVSVLSARTVQNLRTVPTGFDIDHIALLTVDAEGAQYDATRARTYLSTALEQLAAVPGVRAAGYGSVVPLGFGGSRTTIIVPGYEPGKDEDMEINFNLVSERYFESMGIPLVDGRVFEGRDTLDSPAVVVVNQTMAARYWPRSSAVGQRIRLGRNEPDMEVVGVVHDVKYRMLREDASPSFYLSLAQSSRAGGGVLHVRTWNDPSSLLATLRQTLTLTDANVPITTVRTLREQATLNLNDERLAMIIALTLGAAALLLAAVGLYGSMSYAVGQRTRELGVRVALGASIPDLRRLVLGQGLGLCLIGTLIGSGLAVLFARTIEHRLFGVTATDPWTLIASAAILSLVAIVACWVPARRATRVDPVDALRT